MVWEFLLVEINSHVTFNCCPLRWFYVFRDILKALRVMWSGLCRHQVSGQRSWTFSSDDIWPRDVTSLRPVAACLLFVYVWFTFLPPSFRQIWFITWTLRGVYVPPSFTFSLPLVTATDHLSWANNYHLLLSSPPFKLCSKKTRNSSQKHKIFLFSANERRKKN